MSVQFSFISIGIEKFNTSPLPSKKRRQRRLSVDTTSPVHQMGRHLMVTQKFWYFAAFFLVFYFPQRDSLIQNVLVFGAVFHTMQKQIRNGHFSTKFGVRAVPRKRKPCQPCWSVPITVHFTTKIKVSSQAQPRNGRVRENKKERRKEGVFAVGSGYFANALLLQSIKETLQAAQATGTGRPAAVETQVVHSDIS